MCIRGRHFTISTFKCTECGKEGIPISRRQSNQRESGHLKKIYCVHCKKETNHVEIREFDYANQRLYIGLDNLGSNNLINSPYKR